MQTKNKLNVLIVLFISLLLINFEIKAEEFNITAKEIETHENSKIEGNITSKNSLIGGKLVGDINSDRVHINKTADVEGSIKQKTLSIEEGSILKIKTEIKK